MKKISSLKPLHKSFLDRPSKQTIMPLHKEVERIMKRNQCDKSILSYQLGNCWNLLSKAGNEEAELRSIALYKQAVAHRNVSPKGK